MSGTPPPQLTVEQAKEALRVAVAKFREPQNKERLRKIIEDSEKLDDPGQKMMKKMSELVPAVTGILGEAMRGFGFAEEQLMTGVMQMQMLSSKDPELGVGVQRIMAALNGDFSGLENEAEDEVEELE